MNQKDVGTSRLAGSRGRGILHGAGAAALALMLALAPPATAGEGTSPEASPSRALSAADGGLWITDGTAGGTQLLRRRVSGNVLNPDQIWPFGPGRALFRATSVQGVNDAVWMTDGRRKGTRMVKDIWEGNDNAAAFTLLGDGRAMFYGTGQTADPFAEPANGSEPYVTDGMWRGTRMVRDINPGKADSAPADFTPLPDGRLVFVTSRYGNFLWLSDGTWAGTRRLGARTSESWNLRVGMADYLGPMDDGRVIFPGFRTWLGAEPWVTDGTQAGTEFVKDLIPWDSGSNPARGGIDYLSAIGGGRAMFWGYQPGNGQEPWVTDGTPDGTFMLGDINNGDWGSFDGRHDWGWFNTLPDGRVLFAADDGTHGGEPWITDRTPGGTMLVADVVPGPEGSHPWWFAPFGNVAAP